MNPERSINSLPKELNENNIKIMSEKIYEENKDNISKGAAIYLKNFVMEENRQNFLLSIYCL